MCVCVCVRKGGGGEAFLGNKFLATKTQEPHNTVAVEKELEQAQWAEPAHMPPKGACISCYFHLVGPL